EAADAVGAVFGEPQNIVGIDPAAARPRERQRRLPDRHLFGLGVDPANGRAAEIELIGVVLPVGRHAGGADVGAVLVPRLAEVLVLAGGDVEPIDQVGVLVVGPHLAVGV